MKNTNQVSNAQVSNAQVSNAVLSSADVGSLQLRMQRLRSVCALLASGLGCMPAALAQQAGGQGAADQQVAGAMLEAVVVTGSRISRSGFETPMPVTSVSEADLQIKGVRSIATLIPDIPALVPQQNSQTFSTVGAANFDLRNMGPNRTLALLDGRRLAPTNPNGTVDVNFIPAALISSIEIVTGGASAAYGSDAVAGVVNVGLNSTFTGAKADVQYGQSTLGGANEYSGSFAFGAGFGGDRGHVLFSVDGYQNDGESRQVSRDWGRRGWALIANPRYVAGSGNGEPRLLIAPNVRFSQMTEGGVIVSPGPLQNQQILAGGATAPFQRGTDIGGTFMSGGDGDAFWPDSNLLAKVTRQAGFGRVSYDFTDSLTGFADVIYSKSHQFVDIVPNYNNGDLTIARDNAFLPAAIRATMLANNMQSLRMGRTNRELGVNTGNSHAETGLYAVGLKGELGERWSWDTSYQYSQSEFRIQVDDNRNQANWLRSVDSVINPATGLPVCRSTLSDPGNGCAPANVFGPNAISREAVAYTTGVSTSDSTLIQQQAAANVRGEPFSIWAGPVSIAAGVEHRKASISGVSDPVSEAVGWRTLNQRAIKGDYDVSEGYFETVVPLAQTLELNAAARITDYSTSGTVETWKLGLSYAPVQDLRFRGTLSRDIRAPNLAELFAPSRQQINAITDPFTGRTPNPRLITGGNPDLSPEEAQSVTFGVVYQPSWAQGLSASLDAYRIELSDAITTLAAQTLVNQCFAGQTVLCSAITRDSEGNMVEIRQVFFNADELETRGVDAEIAYEFPVAALWSGASGDIRLRLLSTYVDKFSTVSGGVAVEQAGSVNLPSWRGNLSATYQNGPLIFRLQGRFIDAAKLNNAFVEGIDVYDNDVSSRFYLNTSVQYEIRQGMHLFAKIDNLLDRDPPITPSSLIAPQTASSPLYDVIGRFAAVGVRFQL